MSKVTTDILHDSKITKFWLIKSYQVDMALLYTNDLKKTSMIT